jgi:uncharacterized membrane protein YphA (DoxX/SURF4 family)
LAGYGSLVTGRAAEWFIAHLDVPSRAQKLQDLEGFTTMFLSYDLLARRDVRYAYLYPFGETLAGVLMIAGALIWIAARKRPQP